MPEVTIRHQPELSVGEKVRISGHVARIVATELGRLAPFEVMTYFEPIREGDGCFFDLYLRIEAMDLPERKANIADRNASIHLRISRKFPQWTFGVWTKLSEGAWAESDLRPVSLL